MICFAILNTEYLYEPFYLFYHFNELIFCRYFCLFVCCFEGDSSEHCSGTYLASVLTYPENKATSDKVLVLC